MTLSQLEHKTATLSAKLSTSHSSNGGECGERFSPVKDASFARAAIAVLRILDRAEPASPIMPAVRCKAKSERGRKTQLFCRHALNEFFRAERFRSSRAWGASPRQQHHCDEYGDETIQGDCFPYRKLAVAMTMMRTFDNVRAR